MRQLVDMENFVDYMILNFFSGNTDWDKGNWRAAVIEVWIAQGGGSLVGTQSARCGVSTRTLQALILRVVQLDSIRS